MLLNYLNKQSLVSGKIFFKHPDTAIFNLFANISFALGRLILGICHVFYKYLRGAAA
jgi:hypothetical protein